MTVNDHLSTFLNKKVEDYDPAKGIQDTETTVYRIKIDYDEYEKDAKIEDKIEAFANDPRAAEVKELITGSYDFEASNSTADTIEKLVAVKDKLPNLKAIFIGDITYEECEISWIQQSNISPLLIAFPALEYLQVRGGTDLEFSSLNHDTLQTLIIETGGMPPNVVTAVANANLPALTKLVLWLGDENYGFKSTIEDLSPIVTGEKFPHLKYLGLQDSVIQDEIAQAIAASPVLDKIETLDLSMGTLSDSGGQALLESAGIKKLKHLNLRHHFLSDDMMAKLRGLGIDINLDDQEEDDDDYRFIEVSE